MFRIDKFWFGLGIITEKQKNPRHDLENTYDLFNNQRKYVLIC